METSGKQVVFKAILPLRRSSQFGDLVWIAASGQRAVLVDLVTGCPRSAETVGALSRQLDSTTGTLPADVLIQDVHLWLRNAGCQAVAAIIDWHDDTFRCTWIGNPRLFAISRKGIKSLLGTPEIHPMNTLGMDGAVQPHTKELCYLSESIYWLTSDGIDLPTLRLRSADAFDARTEAQWRELGQACSNGDDWSVVVFPVQLREDFSRAHWPYNPFMGAQEEREHEKRGLAAIADALFKQPDFNGFRIVGSGPIAGPNSTRLVDGYLVSPWGVVLLELKDHLSEVKLPLSGKRAPMRVHGQPAWHDEANPVNKIAEALRPFGKWNLGVKLDARLRRIGAVVFTHPQAQVSCLSPEGHTLELPCKYGEVLIVTPSTLAGQLRALVREFIGKSAAPPLGIEEIERVAQTLRSGAAQTSLSEATQRTVDGYLMDPAPLAEESTAYYKVHRGQSAGTRRPVWIKRFSIASLHRDSLDLAALNLGREAEALKELMLSDSVPCVQRYLGGEKTDEEVFVVLQQIDGPRLDTWLSTQPPRPRRLFVLRSLAKTLAALAEVNIVHRALSPANIRIQEGDQPVVINFELCRLEHLATLPISGRHALDRRYVARETNQVGMPVTAASDTYSFGRLACLILTGTLPFDTYEDQSVAAKMPGFWERLASETGVPADDLRQLLMENPLRRPTGEALVRMVEGWQ